MSPMTGWITTGKGAKRHFRQCSIYVSDHLFRLLLYFDIYLLKISLAQWKRAITVLLFMHAKWVREYIYVCVCTREIAAAG